MADILDMPIERETCKCGLPIAVDADYRREHPDECPIQRGEATGCWCGDYCWYGTCDGPTNPPKPEGPCGCDEAVALRAEVERYKAALDAASVALREAALYLDTYADEVATRTDDREEMREQASIALNAANNAHYIVTHLDGWLTGIPAMVEYLREQGFENINEEELRIALENGEIEGAIRTTNVALAKAPTRA